MIPYWSARVPFAVLLLLFQAGTPRQDTWTGVDRVVAVGDVHGDVEQLAAVLRSAELIDAGGAWIGGKAHLVQTGDVLDRGPDSRKAMDLLMRLEEEARRAGGAVHALIGNHEAMVLYGDLRYLSPGEIAAFRDADSEKTREAYFQEHHKNADRRRFEAETPLGLVELRRAFSAEGKYGKWIRGHNAVVQIDGTLFLHGGLSPKFADWSVRRINESVRAELEDFDKLEGGVVQREDGPLWYRGLAQGDETRLEDHVRALLFNYKVDRLVVGHTYTEGAIGSRFGGRVLVIDVGLSRVYDEKGRMACLVIEKGKPAALHRGRRVELPSDAGRDLRRYQNQTSELDRAAVPLKK